MVEVFDLYLFWLEKPKIFLENKMKIVILGSLLSVMLLSALIYFKSGSSEDVGNNDNLVSSEKFSDGAKGEKEKNGVPKRVDDGDDRKQEKLKVDQVKESNIQYLSKTEEKEFFSDINNFFQVNLHSLDKEFVKSSLIKLNKRGRAGARSAVRLLSTTPEDLAVMKDRFSVSDYLVYRMKFDHDLRDDIAEFVSKPVEVIDNKGVQAMKINESIELLRGLSKVDHIKALEVLPGLLGTPYKSFAAVNIELGMSDAGFEKDEIKALIRSVYPEYDVSKEVSIEVNAEV